MIQFHILLFIPIAYCSMILRTVSVPSHRLAPTTDFMAAFAGQGMTESIYAELQAKTLLPVVNLDNLKLRNLSCADSRVIVQFESAKQAAMAASEWKSAGNFAIFIGHERNCLERAGAWKVTMVGNSTANAVALNISPLEWNEFLGKYSFQMSQLQNQNLEKRDFKKTFRMPLKANLRYNSDLAKDSDMMVLQSSVGSVRCLNCTSDGFVNIYLHMTGNPTDIETYNITVNGALKLNFGTRIKLTNGLSKALKVDLLAIPITPIQLPGLFSIGPELALTFGIFTELNQAVLIYTGFAYEATIDFSAYSKKGLNHPPQFRMGGKHAFKKKQTQFKTSKEFHLGVTLSPTIRLAVRAFNFKPLDLGIAWEQNLMVRVSSCFQKLNFKGFIQDLHRKELWTATLLSIKQVALEFKVGKIPIEYILGKQQVQELECINCECLQAKKLLNVTDPLAL